MLTALSYETERVVTAKVPTHHSFGGEHAPVLQHYEPAGQYAHATGDEADCLPKTSDALLSNCFFQSVIWLACTSNFLTGSANVRSPWSAARDALALNSGERVPFFRLIK